MKDGQQLVLRGPSGCGKTTLLNLISGILLPDQGKIFICGTEITGLKESERDRFRAAHIGYLFQDFNLFDALNVEDNLLATLDFSGRYHRRERKQRTERLLVMLCPFQFIICIYISI